MTDESGGVGTTRSVPFMHEQALEAARDNPTRTQLTNMLSSLDAVEFVNVDGEDEQRPTTIDVTLKDEHGRYSGTIMDIPRAAGWKPCYVCFSRNRITFKEVGEQ